MISRKVTTELITFWANEKRQLCWTRWFFTTPVLPEKKLNAKRGAVSYALALLRYTSWRPANFPLRQEGSIRNPLYYTYITHSQMNQNTTCKNLHVRYKCRKTDKHSCFVNRSARLQVSETFSWTPPSRHPVTESCYSPTWTKELW